MILTLPRDRSLHRISNVVQAWDSNRPKATLHLYSLVSCSLYNLSDSTKRQSAKLILLLSDDTSDWFPMAWSSTWHKVLLYALFKHLITWEDKTVNLLVRSLNSWANLLPPPHSHVIASHFCLQRTFDVQEKFPARLTSRRRRAIEISCPGTLYQRSSLCISASPRPCVSWRGV